MTTAERCKHVNIPEVVFDEDTARAENLSCAEVRRRWPRYYGPCPDCGEDVIGYASMSHYRWGDW